MATIESLIQKLQSTNADKRYDACEELRVMVLHEPLPQEAIDALILTTKDPNPDVADAAQRAIALHTQQANLDKSVETEIHKVEPLPFWSNRPKKLMSLLLTVVAVFVLTLPYSLYSIFFDPVLKFPIGLVGLIYKKEEYESLYWNPSSGSVTLLIWVFYLGIAIGILESKTRKVVVFLYRLLILLLILNVAGCQIIGPAVLSGVH